jgi:hypothetical protein
VCLVKWCLIQLSFLYLEGAIPRGGLENQHIKPPSSRPYSNTRVHHGGPSQGGFQATLGLGWILAKELQATLCKPRCAVRFLGEWLRAQKKPFRRPEEDPLSCDWSYGVPQDILTTAMKFKVVIPHLDQPRTGCAFSRCTYCTPTL